MSLKQFKCLNLQKTEPYQELEAVITASGQKHGVYIFYGNETWFEDGSSSGLCGAISKKLNVNSIELELLIKKESCKFTSGLYFIPDQIFNRFDSTKLLSSLENLPGAIRKAALENSFKEASFVLLAPPIFYDFFNRADESLLVTLDKAHEYLLWTDCDTSDSIKPNLISNKQAWYGNGFAGWRFNNYHSEETEEFPYSPSYHEVLDKALEKLHRYEKLLTHNDDVIKNIHQYTHNGFLNALIDFLPAYRHENELITTNSRWPNEPEGPVIWKNIFELNYHQRQLLLDGLLVLWPNPRKDGGYLLQPASLALLYWAAQRLQYPHSTEGPDKFMQYYFDYPAKSDTGKARTQLDWFGGRFTNQ